MASGVKVSDDAIALFNDMKLNKVTEHCDGKKTRMKAVLFCIENGEIVVDKGSEILSVENEEPEEDPYQCFVKRLPPKDCRYALYDAAFENQEHAKKKELVFILWAPEEAPVKSRMTYASSKDAIKKKLTGLKHEWQVNGQDEIGCSDLVDKLCKFSGGSVVSLEGKRL